MLKGDRNRGCGNGKVLFEKQLLPILDLRDSSKSKAKIITRD